MSQDEPVGFMDVDDIYDLYTAGTEGQDSSSPLNDMNHLNITMDQTYSQPEEDIYTAADEMPQPSAPLDIAKFKIKVDWTEPFPERWKARLQKALQSWLSRLEGKPSVLSLELMEYPSCAEVQITPSTALEALKKLRSVPLIFKPENKEVTAWICPDETQCVTASCQTSMSYENVFSSPKVNSSIPVTSAVLEDTNNKDATAANRAPNQVKTTKTAREITVPLYPYWYMHHAYKKEMEAFEKQHGVSICAEVSVSIKDIHGLSPISLSKTSEDFQKLLMGCVESFSDVAINHNDMDSDNVKQAIHAIQQEDKKMMFSMSASDCLFFGPKKFTNMIKRETTRVEKQSEDKLQKNVFDDKTTRREKLIGYSGNIPHPKGIKWNQTLDYGPGAVGGAVWDEGVNLRSRSEADMGFSEESKVNSRHDSKSAHAEEEICFICMDSFTDKEKLKCGHEFCHQCIKMSVDCLGPICPVCKEVFGKFTHAEEEICSICMDSFTNKEKLKCGHEFCRQCIKMSVDSLGPICPVCKEVFGKFTHAEDEICSICMDSFTNKEKLKCGHEFCRQCIKMSLECLGPICPVCKEVFGKLKGNQPDGTMTVTRSRSKLSGYPQCGTIEITYNIPSGIQTNKHPNPGKPFHGANRRAYLPDNNEGKEVLRLLQRAFQQKLIFTVGKSATSGLENAVIWNHFHHKTNICGGPEMYGYPDSDYLKRVKDELKARGIE